MEARELVIGDVIILEEGNTIPADAKILAGYDDKDGSQVRSCLASRNVPTLDLFILTDDYYHHYLTFLANRLNRSLINVMPRQRNRQIMMMVLMMRTTKKLIKGLLYSPSISLLSPVR